ncbi:UNVERIFIED_CONTAM: hypothetical protein HDU68_004588 [Siphonaria sp. JEL0065]|nr:hypothetical protein HDU68_004588 [Siphonaria sp. JEL0065]
MEMAFVPTDCVSFYDFTPVAATFPIATASEELCAAACPGSASFLLAPQVSSVATRTVLCACGNQAPGAFVVDDVASCDIKCSKIVDGSCGGINNDLGVLAWQLFVTNGTTATLTATATASLDATSASASESVSGSLSASLTTSPPATATVTNLTASASLSTPISTLPPQTSKVPVFVNGSTIYELVTITVPGGIAAGVSSTTQPSTTPIVDTLQVPANNIAVIAGIWVGAFVAIGVFAVVYKNVRTRRNSVLESEADDDLDGPDSPTVGAGTGVDGEPLKKKINKKNPKMTDFEGNIAGAVKNSNRISVYSVTGSDHQFQYIPNLENPLGGTAVLIPKDELKRKVLNHFAAVAATDPLALPLGPGNGAAGGVGGGKGVGLLPLSTFSIKEDASIATIGTTANAVLGTMPSDLEKELATEGTETVLPFTGLFGQNPSHPSWFQDPNNSRSKVYRRRVTTSNAGPGGVGPGNASIGRASIGVRSNVGRVSRRQFGVGGETESLMSYQSSERAPSDVFNSPNGVGSKKRRNASSVYMNLLEQNEKVRDLKI